MAILFPPMNTIIPYTNLHECFTRSRVTFLIIQIAIKNLRNKD